MGGGKAQNFILYVFIFLLSLCVVFNKFGFLSKICSKMLLKNNKQKPFLASISTPATQMNVWKQTRNSQKEAKWLFPRAGGVVFCGIEILKINLLFR